MRLSIEKIYRVFLLTILLIAAAFACKARAAAAVDEELKFTVKINTYAGGGCRIEGVHPAGRLDLPINPARHRRAGANPAALSWPTLLASLSWHWDPETATLEFNRTELSDTYGKKIGKILKSYINKRRGNAYVPQMRLTSTVDSVKPIRKFKNPDDFYTQFDGDGSNTVVMTADDQFFKDADGAIIDADVVSTTLLIGRADVEGWTGDEYFGKLWIDEADVYLRSDFFSRSKLEYNVNGAAAFSMALGYKPTAWSHDYLSKNRAHVTKSAFGDAKSDVWTKISNERDNLYYLDDLALIAPDYLDTPRLLPFEDEVIDISGYTSPSTDPNEPFPFTATPVLFLTNLKAYDGKYKLVVVLSRVTGGSPPAAKKLLKVSGNCLDYPMIAEGGEEFYPEIRLTEIRLGRESDLAKLSTVVEKYGTAQTIDGVAFNRALKIQVDISGRLFRGGKIIKLTRSFWLADSDKP